MTRPGGHTAQTRAYNLAWQKAYPDKRRSYHLKHQYGLTMEQYDRMLAAQGGVCKLCGRPPKTRRLDVDHDHPTGRVRGLCCFQCNRLRMSRANDSDAALYEKIAAYLRSTFDGRSV